MEEKYEKAFIEVATNASLSSKDKALWFFTALKFGTNKPLNCKVLRNLFSEEEYYTSLLNLQKEGFISFSDGYFQAITLDSNNE